MKLLDRKITHKINDMINDIVATCNRILSTETKVDEEASYDSKDDAKNRLKLVLMHDRSQLTPAQMEQMREEMVDVISRYVEIDRDALDLCLESETNTIALVANIPISRAKKEEQLAQEVEKVQDVPQETAQETQPETDMEDQQENTENNEDQVQV